MTQAQILLHCDTASSALYVSKNVQERFSKFVLHSPVLELGVCVFFIHNFDMVQMPLVVLSTTTAAMRRLNETEFHCELFTFRQKFPLDQYNTIAQFFKT